LQESLKDCFSEAKDPKHRSGNFVRRSEDIKSYGVSKTVDAIRKIRPKMAFMVE